MDIIFENINYLIDGYESDAFDNRLVRIKTHNNNEYLLEKSEIINIVSAMINNNKFNLDSIRYLLDRLQSFTSNGNEIDLVINLKNSIEKYILNELCNINYIEKDKTISIYRDKNNFILSQCRNFDNFKINQNNYDNMISIMKIVLRLKERGIIAEYKDFVFNINNDKSDLFKNDILCISTKYFESIRFMI